MILCVIIKVVILFSVTILLVISIIFLLVLGSRAAVCSSSNRSSGVSIVAIKRVSACLCPPLSPPTSFFNLCSSPKPSFVHTDLKYSLSLLLTPSPNLTFLPRLYASPIFSSIVICGAVPFRGS